MKAQNLVSLAASGVAACVLLSAAPASAERIRAHGSSGVAKAVTGPQQTEFSWGVTGAVAVELGLLPWLGAQLQGGAVWMHAGDPPEDSQLAAVGDASALHAGGGIRLRPFASVYDGRKVSPAGMWLGGSGGVTQTAGLTRPMFDVQAGYDVLMNQGRIAVGPMLGFLRVFQPNDQLRPADAQIAYFGIHFAYDPAAKLKVEGDRDNDGFRDSRDSCPEEPEDRDGFEDLDGCPEPDNDGDGVLDQADRCPNHQEDVDGFEDDDGCPEVDNDRDRIDDNVDGCPDDPEDRDGFQDEDGCPDPDNDADGVADGEDLCPEEAETQNGYADHDGCPDSEQIRVVGDRIILDERVHFLTNSAVIRLDSHPLLTRLAALVGEHPEYVHVEVQGHTDERGPDWYNDRLSYDRAASVMQFLIDQGIDSARLGAVGFGSSRPLIDDDTPQALYMNRRVELQVTREVKKTVGVGGPASPSIPGAIRRGQPGETQGPAPPPLAPSKPNDAQKEGSP